MAKIIIKILNFFGLISRESFFYKVIFYKFRKFKKNEIIFFHINRSAGNSLYEGFKIISNDNIYKIIRFPHKIKPKYIFNKKINYILNIRDPIDRFRSIYNSKKEEFKISKNLNTNYVEQVLFYRFTDLNDLCENLFDKKIIFKNYNTIQLIKNFSTLGEFLQHWISLDYFNNNKPFHIFDFKSLQNDFNLFTKKINFHKKIDLEYMKTMHNIKSNNNITSLSSLSINNLKYFLKDDIKIYNHLIKNKDRINKNILY